MHNDHDGMEHHQNNIHDRDKCNKVRGTDGMEFHERQRDHACNEWNKNSHYNSVECDQNGGADCRKCDQNDGTDCIQRSKDNGDNNLECDQNRNIDGMECSEDSGDNTDQCRKVSSDIRNQWD